MQNFTITKMISFLYINWNSQKIVVVFRENTTNQGGLSDMRKERKMACCTNHNTHNKIY